MTNYPPASPYAGPGGLMTPPALGQVPVGAVLDWPGPGTIPGDWLDSYGQSVLRATYPRLFSALNVVVGAATVTVASPGVFTQSSHGLLVGQPIFFRIVSGVTGFTANVTYYVQSVPTANTYTITASRTINVITGAITPGAAINTGGVAGIAEAWFSPYEVADSTHFYLPDYRGRVSVALDNMGGSDAGFSVWPNILGLRAGEGTHTLLTAEAAQKAIAATGNQSVLHTHTLPNRVVIAPIGGGNLGSAGSYNEFTGLGTSTESTLHQHSIAGEDAAGAHNTVQPSIAVRKIIYAGVTA